jgi:hypothetical protein
MIWRIRATGIGNQVGGRACFRVVVACPPCATGWPNRTAPRSSSSIRGAGGITRTDAWRDYRAPRAALHARGGWTRRYLR